MNIFSIVANLIRFGSDFLIPSRKDILQWELEELRKIRMELEQRRPFSDEDFARTTRALEEASKIEDVERAIEYLKASAKQLICPICRALHVHMIEYLLRYDYKTKLVEQGVPIDKLNEEIKKYGPEIKRKVDEIRKELKIDVISLRESRKKFLEIITKPL